MCMLHVESVLKLVEKYSQWSQQPASYNSQIELSMLVIQMEHNIFFIQVDSVDSPV